MAPRNRRASRDPRANAYEQISLFDAPKAREQPAAPEPGTQWVGPSPSSRAASRRVMSKELADAIQLAKDGDDSELLPYQPTPSINPPRPRTRAAGYDRESQTLRIRFRNGQVYGYYNVPPNVWRNFRRVKSPGRFVNRTLNYFPYAPETDLDEPTGVN